MFSHDWVVGLRIGEERSLAILRKAQQGAQGGEVFSMAFAMSCLRFSKLNATNAFTF